MRAPETPLATGTKQTRLSGPPTGAFPKNGSAEDLLMNAPSDVSEKQLKELGIRLA